MRSGCIPSNLTDRKKVYEVLHRMEPEEVRRRKNKRFKRNKFYAAGVMAVLAMDQHDKWGQYHLWLHVGIEPVSGYVAWLKIWRTNHNPRLIAKYYLDAIRELGGILHLFRTTHLK
jgi:hypothetical protein